tara:strand:- start:160 stop:843 length:684 start_codon:yes stop_codon:yes gene_type:complete
MGTYSNPGGPSGMLPDDSEKKKKTTTDAGQLGYHVNSKDKSAQSMTDAVNQSAPGSGPMKTSTAGTYNFSKGFTLGGDKGGSFAGQHISGLKSSLSDVSKPTGYVTKSGKMGGISKQEYKDAKGKVKLTSKEEYTKKKEGVPTGSYVMRAGGAKAGEDERLNTKENRQDLRSQKQTDRRAEKRLKSATKAAEKRNKPTREDRKEAKWKKKEQKGLEQAMARQARERG